MYTLDGRLHFALALNEANEADFIAKKLYEIVLSKQHDGVFELVFQFGDNSAENAVTEKTIATSEFPEYVVVEEVQ